MIVFEGNVGKACETFVCKRERIFIAKVWSFVSILFAIPTVIIAINWEMIVLLFLVALALFPLGTLLPLSKKTKETMLSTKIQIGEEIMSCEGKRFKFEYYTKDVKQVTDYGDFYMMDFYYPNRNSYFACQKDLITEGSIEDFEKLFSEKLVKAEKE